MFKDFYLLTGKSNYIQGLRKDLIM